MSIQYTSRLTAPYPQLPETADVPRDIAALSARLDAVCVGYSEGTALPAYGKHGWYFYRTDTGRIYYDIGTAWLDMTPSAFSIPDNSLTAQQIAEDAITASELANNAVDTNALLDGAVTSAKILDGTIVAGDIANALKPSTGAGGSTEALRALGPGSGLAAPGTHGNPSHDWDGYDPLNWPKNVNKYASGIRRADEVTSVAISSIGTSESNIMSGGAVATLTGQKIWADFICPVITIDETGGSSAELLLRMYLDGNLYATIARFRSSGSILRTGGVYSCPAYTVPGDANHTFSVRAIATTGGATPSVNPSSDTLVLRTFVS